MTEYVVGSLSALFGKKSSKDAVQLKSVKPLYDEYVPPKPKRNQPPVVKEEVIKASKKRKLHNADIDERQLNKKAKNRADQDVVDSEDVKPAKTVGSISSNKEAALKRIEQKKRKFKQTDQLKTESKQSKKETLEKEGSLLESGEENEEGDETLEENNDGEKKRTFRYYEDDPAYHAQTIFVKNLPSKTQRKHLKKLFASVGDILFVRFVNAIPAKSTIPVEAAIKKRSLIKEGTTICAYVVFKEASCVPSALKFNGMDFEGHHLRVDKRDAANVPPKRSVFCGNIPFDTTDDQLWEFFEEAGPVDYVRIVRNNETGEGKGIAFVVFKDSSSALMALDFSKKTFNGREIRVTAIEKRKTALPSTKNALMSGSKEKINKKKLEKKASKQEKKTKKVLPMNKQKKERIKKSIKKEKAQRTKKTFARKLQGLKK